MEKILQQREITPKEKLIHYGTQESGPVCGEKEWLIVVDDETKVVCLECVKKIFKNVVLK